MRKTQLLFVIVAVFALVFANYLFAQMAEIKVGKGDLKIGGILQAGYDYTMSDDENNVNGQFTLNRARFLFWGTIVPDKVKYFVQTETKSAPELLDFKMIFVNVLPKTSITVGRFLPNFSLYMPAPTSMLDMINYPLFLSKYAMWRQTGFQTETALKLVDINLGLFNGPTNNVSDNNDGKDFMFKLAFKPPTDFAKISLGAYGWMGNMLMADKADLAYNRYAFFGTLNKDKLSLKGEYIMATDEVGENIDNVSSSGFYGQLGYKVTDKIELLGRYESLDPNSDVKDDASSWVTIGANHYIDGINAMIYLNYIMKLEENDWGADSKLKNDVLQLQFQIAF